MANNYDPNDIGDVIRKNLKFILLGIVAIGGLAIFFMSWEDVEPGEEGFIYRPYGGGVDSMVVYPEGTYFVAPWNEMITYSILRESKNYKSTVMDKNGTDITVNIAVNFAVQESKSSKLHLTFGKKYSSFIDDKAQGAIKDVIGRYTYEEVYSTKRESLEGEIETILKSDFDNNYLTLHYVEIADVDLPSNIAQEIINKETQKQKNLTAKEKQKEEEYLANAKIEKARGDSSLVVSAKFKAEAIQLEAEQISQNPQYIELKKWEKWDGNGSPYGEGNVFGEGVSILKQQ
jgi:regulator of protease activity HflC (stomatin/prohibitin superfamily)